MADCPFYPQLDAYHDGELSPQQRRQLEQHLPGCAACTAELAEMRELSGSIQAAAGAAFVAPDESRRMHDAVTRAAEQRDQPSRMLIRTASVLSALAASILIVCGVWLIDARSARPSPVASGSRPLAVAPEWERVAWSGRADPRSELLDDSPLSPRYAATVQYMLSGLTSVDEKQWVKPGSF